MTDSFTRSAWDAVAPVVAAIRSHPFNRALEQGDMPRPTFLFYMIQDAHYLVAFAKALAVVAAKAPDVAAQDRLVLASHEALIVERALHERFFAAFEVAPALVEATPPSPTCEAYADFLLASAWSRSYAVGLASLLPCFEIYWKVGQELLARLADRPVDLPPHPYRAWIDTYADDAFGDQVRAVMRLVDEAAAAAGEAERRAMLAGYAKAARLEWMFFDHAWRREAWPV